MGGGDSLNAREIGQENLAEGHSAGDGPSAARLFELLYSTIHDCARREMLRQPAGHSLQATALVNEVYLRLCKEEKGTWSDRGHFLKAVAQAMRHALVDHARRKGAMKRQVEREDIGLDHIVLTSADSAPDLEALHAALDELAEFEPEMAQAVELRFFAGLSLDAVAKVLDIPKRTLDRRWAVARAWLYRRVQ